MARRILGLDLGSHAIKAVEMRQTLRDLEVVQLRTLSLDDPSPSLAAEIREFLQLHDLPTSGAVVAIAGDRVSSRRLSFPFRDKRKIEPAVPFELEAQVPFELDDFVIDWEVVAEQREQAEVAATLAPRSEVTLLLEMLHEAQVEVRIVEAEGLVLANLASAFDLPGPRLLGDIGHRKTTLCLCLDGRGVAARTLPVGGEAITRAVAKDRGLGEIEAERLKIEQGIFGGAGHPECPSAVEVIDRLAREMLRTLGSAEELLDRAGEDLPQPQIVIMGGSARLHELDRYLSERTSVQAVRLPLPKGEMGAALLAGGDPMVFGPATALALRGSAQAVSRMNFRKDEFAQRVDLRQMTRDLRPTAMLAGLVLLLGGASLATDAVLQGRRADRAEAAAREIYSEILPGAVPSNLVAAMQSALRDAEKEAETLGVFGGHLSALDILTELSRRVPRDLGVVFEQLSIDRQVIQIKGHLPEYGGVDRLEKALTEAPLFRSLTVGDITGDARRGGTTFSVRISLAPPETAR
ncbi:MAG: pilus assembly protein PilM [bacterium]|nr:pilus assembly protein PilM [bacterium]